MNVDRQFVVGLYQAVEAAPDQVKNLNQRERELVMFALKSLNGTESPELTTSQRYQINQIKAKLKSSSEPPSNNFIEKMVKGVLNKVGLRVSSAQIKKEFTDIQAKIHKDADSIPDRIISKKENIQEWKELLDFNPKAAAHYRDIASFLKDVPEKMEEAIPKLKEKIEDLERNTLPRIREEFKEEFKAKNNGRDPSDSEIKGGLVQVLEKEILASLKNMVDYPNSGPKTLLIKYENDLIKEGLEKQGVDTRAVITRDIKALPQDVQEEIKKKIEERRRELTETDEGKALIQSNFKTEMDKQITAYNNSTKNAEDPAITKQAHEDIQRLEEDILKLQQQQANLEMLKRKS
jgi:hypothetical protein